MFGIIVLMNMIKMGLEGLYDSKTYRKQNTHGLNTLVFDCNPKSLQFIQAYVIVDILKTSAISTNVVLKFQNEKSFVIDSLIKQILQETSIGADQIEVWINPDAEWLNGPTHKFKITFGNFKTKSFLDHNLFQGFVFDAADFENNYAQNSEQKLLVLLQLLKGRRYQHTLVVSPFDSLPMALIDYLEIHHFIVRINSDVEVCYRNVDQEKLSSCFTQLKKNLQSIQF